MSDVRDQSGASNTPASGVAPQSPGHWLREERERQGVTVQRIAADMHLSVGIIEAIEQNRFAAVGAPVFAKGYLRKYASLLKLPVNRVFELYEKIEGAPRDVDPVPLTQRAPEPALRPAIRDMLGVRTDSAARRVQPLPWIVAIVILGFVVLIAAWLVVRTPKEPVTSGQTSEQASEAVSATSEVHQEVAHEITPTLQPAPAAPATVLASSQTTTPAIRSIRSMGNPPPGKVRVRFTFVRESWVEVYDANGNRILYDVGRADLPRMVDVEPPALVVLGDADAVTAEANNKPVTIPRKNIQGSVARFTVAADGTVK